MRKQTLYILKTVLHINANGGGHSSGVSETTRKKHSNPQGMTKREAWAEMEAKSLGVGRVCNPTEPNLSSQQKWKAFVLLYEMLEEYGTHLVEAAWNHQVVCLIFVLYINVLIIAIITILISFVCVFFLFLCAKT